MVCDLGRMRCAQKATFLLLIVWKPSKLRGTKPSKLRGTSAPDIRCNVTGMCDFWRDQPL